MKADPEIKIRDMRSWDVDKILEIERKAFPTPWGAEIFLRGIRNDKSSIYLVASDDKRILGYLGSDFIGYEVHLTNLAVDEDCRRAGIGSLLLIECTKRGLEKGARWMTLEVREGNDSALEFYRHFGFEILGIKMGYYYDTGENAVLMCTGDIREPEYMKMIADFKSSIEERLSLEARDS